MGSEFAASSQPYCSCLSGFRNNSPSFLDLLVFSG